MAPINIVVATTSVDIKADGIAASVADRTDMRLVENQVFSAEHPKEILALLPVSERCAVVLVGWPEDTSQQAQQFLAQRADLIVLQVDIVGDGVRIGLRNPHLEVLLDMLRELAERNDAGGIGRIARVQIEPDAPDVGRGTLERRAPIRRPLLQAAIHWVHGVLYAAVEQFPKGNDDTAGLSLSRATMLQLLDPQPHHARHVSDQALRRALAAADPRSEPLAAVARALGLKFLEFKLLVLALSPELDIRYQRCIGFLLDDMSRRVGTIALYCDLLGNSPRIRAALARRNTLWQWLIFDGRTAVADEALRLDPSFAEWLLGDGAALTGDSRLHRALRLAPWPGAGLLKGSTELATATGLLDKLQSTGDARWIILGGDEPASWRAVLELGARCRRVAPIRVEPARLAGLEAIEVEDIARRIGRMALFTGNPLVVDVANSETADDPAEHVSRFLTSLEQTGCNAAILADDPARVLRQAAAVRFEIVARPALSAAQRVSLVRAAAMGTRAYLTQADAESITNSFPLSVAGLEQAMRLATSSPIDNGCQDALVQRFVTACRHVAVEGLSRLAERVEPVFRLEDVVLPPDRKRQLSEIVNHVRLAPKVLDGWKFREQLPFGRGVTALFFGPSGTGKTMAALGVARELGVQLLRVDLSRVVSKYIGDTEKNIDRVFRDAERSGSTILIDEADALLGKRSEVKDAHDRYANIEVAYLLQRMEAYEGLAILTSNLRQNVDAAFLRRLRFVIDFPRPDLAAREQIWRFCLPRESHDLDDAAFRQLARKIDLTGGHIRQITLRAAFLAAAANERISLKHIAEAAIAEFAKLGLPPVQVDDGAGRRAA